MTFIRSLHRQTIRVLVLFGMLATVVAVPGTHALASNAAAAAVHKPVPGPPPGAPPTHVVVPKARHVAADAAIPVVAVWSVSLAASCPSTLWATQGCTLTATADGDVGPSPYYIQIWNQSTNTLLASCGSGTTCAVSAVSSSAATLGFVAYIGGCCGNPPPSEAAVSNQLSLHWQSIDYVTMAGSQIDPPLGAVEGVGGSDLVDVGPTPFYIQVWDVNTKALLWQCGSGQSCGGQVSYSTAATHGYLATIATYATAFPPPNLQAQSETIWITWNTGPWQVSVDAPTHVTGSETVTATANANVLQSPYYIEIYAESADGTGGTLIGACGGGTTCSASYTPVAGRENWFVAFIASYSTTLPPVNAQAASGGIPGTMQG